MRIKDMIGRKSKNPRIIHGHSGGEMNIVTKAPDKAALPQTITGTGEGVTGPTQFPAIDPDRIRHAYEIGEYPYGRAMGSVAYEAEKAQVQAELLKVQIWAQDTGQKFVILMEGRDAAGKGGTIKRFMEHLNPRYARVVALSKPSDTERGQWYFQRYIQHLPTAGEIVFFDRSWYNRAGVAGRAGTGDEFL